MRPGSSRHRSGGSGTDFLKTHMHLGTLRKSHHGLRSQGHLCKGPQWYCCFWPSEAPKCLRLRHLSKSTPSWGHHHCLESVDIIVTLSPRCISWIQSLSWKGPWESSGTDLWFRRWGIRDRIPCGVSSSACWLDSGLVMDDTEETSHLAKKLPAQAFGLYFPISSELMETRENHKGTSGFNNFI